MIRTLAPALAGILLLQEPSDPAAEKAKLDEGLAIAAEGVAEQLIKLKAWDEARAFLELIHNKSDARKETLDKLLSKIEMQGSGLKWEQPSSETISSFGRNQATHFLNFSKGRNLPDGGIARWAEAEGAILHDLLDYVKAYSRIAQIRTSYGLPKVKFDWKLSVPALWHARYLMAHPLDAREDEGKKGFTPEGAESARRSISSHAESLTDLITNLVHSPFDRAFVYQPRLLRIGFGQTDKPTSVFDVQSGLTAKDTATDLVLPIPKHGSNDVPLSGYDDVTRIIPHKSMRELGYPLTLVFFGGAPAVTDVKARLTENWKEVASYVSTPEDPALPQAFPDNNGMVLIIPKTPLKPRTQYTVTIDFTSRGKPKQISWSFKTSR